jgi:MscS family membrane protein
MRELTFRGSRVGIVLAVLTAAACLAVSAQDEDGPDLSSPRATFDAFLSSMVAVNKGERARMSDAVATLDLSSVSSVVRSEAAPKIARNLKNYLDRVEYIDIESIPVEVDGNRWVYRRSSKGEVSLTRDEDGRWRFSTATVESVPALLESVRGREVVGGIEGGGGVAGGFADWLRDRVPATMRSQVFLLENWQWVGLILLVFVGVVIDWTIRLTLGRWVRRLLSKSEHLREHKADADFAKPIGIFAMALSWWAFLRLLDLPLNALAALRFATQLMMAGAGVWAAYRLVDLVAAHFLALSKRTDTKVDDILVPMVRRALKIVVIAFGVLFVAQNLDIDITSLLAGLGIGGIAFALAAKDTVENLFGSFTVLIDRPFQIGDWVVIEGLEGTVEELGFRSTRIRTFYNSVITVPNATLVNASVDNLGVRRYRRLSCKIGVQYDTTPDRIEAFCEGVRELIRKHPYTRKDYYMVYFNEFADSSLNILLYTFFITPDWTTELRERHRLLVDIVRLAHRLGVQFAFPTRTLHLSSAPAGLGSSSPSPSAPPPPGASSGDPIELGRAEADAIVAGLWGDGKQAPVTFKDPDGMAPGGAEHDAP